MTSPHISYPDAPPNPPRTIGSTTGGREAKADPASHRDLIVRVAGYSDYFCDLSSELQDEIIERTEHQAL